MSSDITPGQPPKATNSTAEDEFVVLVPVSNPKTQAHLISLGAALAHQRNGRVVAVSIVQVPDQTSLEAAREQFDYQESVDILAGARRTSTEFGAPIETHTIFSHNLFKTVFATAKRYDSNICVMGWGAELPGVSGRPEPLIDELAHSLPCNFLLFKDRGFDPSNVLLPTTGGPHTNVAAEVARALQLEFESEVTLLHVTDDPEKGEPFLASWAVEHDLEDTEKRVEVGGIESVIETVGQEHSMILIGATEAGVLARLARGSLTLNVLHDVECSVLITEAKTNRGFLERVFRRH